MSRFGAIVSFELDATLEETRAFTRRVNLWTLAESLGGVKSLFCHPATMTHASVEPDVRRSVGISDSLIRLSAGLEDVRDLIEDLEQALARSAGVSPAGQLASSPPLRQAGGTPAVRSEVVA